MPRLRLPRPTFDPRRLRLIASVLVTTLVVTSLAVFAFLNRGYPANRVDLNDAGVWVTNDGGGLFGRLNKSASSLDAFFNPYGGAQSAYTLDVVQDAGTVLAWDKAGAKLSPVEVASAKLLNDNSVPMPSSMMVDMRAGTVAVLEPATGKIWATRYAADSGQAPNLTSLASTAKPIAEITAASKSGTFKEGAHFSALVVDTSGAVHAADITGKAVTIPVAEGVFGKPVTSTVPKRESIALTAVGGHVVALDVIGGTVTVDDQQPGKRQEVVAGSVLQVAGPDNAEVLMAAPKALYGFSVSTPQASARLLSDAGAGTPAQPVRVSGCAYGAWSGSPGTVVKGCGQDKASPLTVRKAGAVLSKPVFRVNRSQVLVNDTADGQLYDLDTLERVDNWQEVKESSTDQTVVDQQLVEQNKEKPKANPDNLGARPGRTTILHVLDNDSDKSGRVLSISSVSQPGNPNAKATISPDGQTVIYTLSDKGGSADFTYQVSNGVAEEKGDVHVEDRGLVNNEPPRLKDGASDPALTVASGGTLPIQVLDLWRDADGDPVGLASADTSTGTTNLTSDGRIELSAAATDKAAKAKVTYRASDGRSDPVPHDLAVSVLASDEIKSSPVVTQPDVGRGEVGRPIVISPLLNDIPGADPLNPKAVMKVAAPVAPKEGLQVSTDVVSGQVAVTGTQPGHFFLEYAAAFGSAAPAPGSLRVDIDPASQDTRSPVAVPDKAVVRGTGSVLVDVLSNDSDPLGSILTVQSAAAADSSQLQAAVINGRWVKLTPSTAAFTQNPTFVTYRLSNGVAPSVEGVISVTQLAAANPDKILTRPDYATVRAGDATTIRVLENDAALSGATLSLLGNVPGAVAPGQLKVYNPGSSDPTGGEPGSAYVSGDAVRFVAPQTVKTATKLIVEYIAQTEAGDRGTGTIEVTVNPEPSETSTNQAPTPHPVEVRAVSGETVRIPINPTNGDPDGDSTSVTGIASAPTLGRVLGYSPTAITYQAYPDAAAQGTDTFSYVVTDRYGASATSTVRVGVTPPTLMQAPVPAALAMTASPGSTVRLYPLPSAAFVKTDPVRVLPLSRFGSQVPSGATVDEQTNSITAVAGSAKDRPVQFSYGLIGNGGESAPATVTVYAVDGFKNPPRVQDTTVSPDGSGKATIDVLATAYDPDGDSRKLKVTKVGLPQATVSGGKVTVPVTKNVRAVPFEVTDESGATSAAVIYVPSEGAGGPFARSGKTIQVPEGKSVTVKVADYVDDPQHKPVMLTFVDKIKAGPNGKVTASAPSGTELTVTGAAGYIGPGAVVAEFTDGKTLDDPQGITTFVSIPVQVGPETPVLRCPTEPVPVVRGGREVPKDITSFCSVWSPNQDMAAKLTFEGTWTTPLEGVKITNGRSLVIDASSDATPGQAGVISVTAAGTKATASPMNVVVQEAPLATLSPITLPEMKAGEKRDVDLTSYFSSKLKDPHPKAISIEKTVGMDAQSAVNGMTASITPAAASHGRMEFKVTVTDVNEKNATDQARRVTGTIAFDVFTRPDPPGAPQPQSALMSRSATLSWTVPSSNGAPITEYEVSWGGGTQSCPSTPCTITGLTNGDDYTFRVRARNKADWSDFSGNSPSTRPNAMPLAVVATQTAANDHSVTLTWPSAQGEGSPITDYIVAYEGRQQPLGSALTATLSVSANGPPVTFTLVAKNNSVPGPSSTVVGYAAGTPSIDGPVVPKQAVPADSDVTTVTVDVAGVNKNGPQPATVSVTRDGTALPACTNMTGTTCVDQGVKNGQTYTYTAMATTSFLGVTRTSAPKTSAPITPYGIPAAWGSVTARAADLGNNVRLTYTVPPSRGKTSTVSADLGNGWVTIPGPGPAGGAGNATVQGRQGGGQVTLKVCNEGGQCSQSGAVPYNAYGDTSTPVFINGAVNGPSVCVGTQASASGWDATLTLNGPGVSQSTSGSGGLQIDQRCANVGYNATANFTATITDSGHPNGEPGRSTRSAVWSAATGPPPRPYATVTHGNTPYSGTGTCAGCYDTSIELHDFRPKSQVYCFVKGISLVSWDVTRDVNENGYAAPSSQGNQGTLWSVNKSGFLPNGNYYADAPDPLCVQK